MRRFRVGIVIAGCFFSCIAGATTVSFTGSQLVSAPEVSYPEPSAYGIRFINRLWGPFTRAPFAKLVAIDSGKPWS
jgi:hypothetical protein